FPKVVHGRNRIVDHHAAAADEGEFHLPVDDGGARFVDYGQRLQQLVGVADEVADRSRLGVASAGFQQLLGGGIHVVKTVIVVENHYCGSQVIQQAGVETFYVHSSEKPGFFKS